MPLRDFAVSGPTAAASIVAWPGRPDLPERVHLSDLECDDTYRAALAVMDASVACVVTKDLDSLLAGVGIARQFSR
jgi:hypothetical protein